MARTVSTPCGYLGRLGEDGTAAVELALIAPVLVVILAAVVDIGFATRQQMQVQDAAAAGALYATENGFSVSGIEAAVTGSISTATIAASPAPTLYCGCPSATAVATVVCTVNCSDGYVAREYVLINASMTRTVFLPTTLVIPATLTATAVTRIK